MKIKLSKEEESFLFKQTKRLLLAEIHGYKYARSKLAELKKQAEANQSDFYLAALDEFNCSVSGYDNITNIRELKYVDNAELTQLARKVTRCDFDFEKLSTNDIYDYFINLNDDNAICNVDGNSMSGIGIYHEDIVIYNKKQTAVNDDIIVGSINRKLFIKRYKIVDNMQYLYSEHPDYKPVKIEITDIFVIFGVVRNIFRNIRKKN